MLKSYDMDLGRFKVIQRQRSRCQSITHGWFLIFDFSWRQHRICHRFEIFDVKFSHPTGSPLVIGVEDTEDSKPKDGRR